MSYRTFATVSLALLSGCADADRPSSTDGARAVRQSVTGGAVDDASRGGVALLRGNSPSLVLLVDTCSASLIAPNVVLTARHCVERMSQAQGCSGTFTGVRTHGYFAIQVESDLSQASERYVVSEVRTPPANGMCDGDIAALVLERNVPDGVLTPIAVRVAKPPVVGEAYTAIGYGGATAAKDEADGLRRSRSSLSVVCVGTSCGEASFWLGPGATCNGDSGGPAIDALGSVFGVAVRGNTCASPGGASAYARTDAHAALIVGTVLDAAKLGGYSAPSWAVLPPPPPPSDDDAGPSGDGGPLARDAGSSRPPAESPSGDAAGPAPGSTTSGCAIITPRAARCGASGPGAVLGLLGVAFLLGRRATSFRGWRRG